MLMGGSFTDDTSRGWMCTIISPVSVSCCVYVVCDGFSSMGDSILSSKLEVSGDDTELLRLDGDSDGGREECCTDVSMAYGE